MLVSYDRLKIQLCNNAAWFLFLLNSPSKYSAIMSIINPVRDRGTLRLIVKSDVYKYAYLLTYLLLLTYERHWIAQPP